MSVALNSKSGEVGEDSVNLMARGRQIPVWWIGVAAVCLGLLLLILIGVVSHNSWAFSHQDLKYVNLIQNLTTDRDTLRDELDQMKNSSSNLTKEMEVLQGKYNAMTASRDKIQEEVNTLKSNITSKTCSYGWKPFQDKCYYFSDGASKTWEKSREDCKVRGADLAIIKTKEVLDFVRLPNGITWIGMSDKEHEGNWKWVDGTALVDIGFWQSGEPNNSHGNEDCVELSRSKRKFNDAPCNKLFSWVCEY